MAGFAWKPNKKKQSGEEDKRVDVEDYMCNSLLPEDKANPLKRKMHTPTPTLKEQMAKTVKEGLERPIGEENKGFHLLRKMGFKPGEGLGRSGEGSVEPLALTVSQSRTGVGADSAMKRTRLLDTWKTEFRGLQANRTNQRKMLRDISQCEKVCETMDTAKGLPCSEMWAWESRFPTQTQEQTGEEAQAKDVEADEPGEAPVLSEEQALNRMEMLLMYLRNEHSYCYWCGADYNDAEDMQAHCPGPNEDDH